MRILAHLLRKDTAIRVIDTHAGAGLYDLGSDAAQRTGEWIDGIGRLKDDPLEPAAEALLQSIAPPSPPLPAIGSSIRAHRPSSAMSCGRRTGPPSTSCTRKPCISCAGRWAGTSAWSQTSSTAISPGKPRCHRRNGAGWCWSIRPSSVMTSSTAWQTVSPPWPANGPPALPCSGITVKNQRRVSLFEAALAESAFPRILLVELHVGETRSRGALGRLRHRYRQPALEAGRNCSCCCRPCLRGSARGHGPLAGGLAAQRGAVSRA